MTSVTLIEWFPFDKGQLSPACRAASQRSSGILTKGMLLIDRESSIFPPVTSSSAEVNQKQLLTRNRFSLGTRPSKNRKGGSGKSAGVEVYTAPGMQAHF